MTIYTCDSNLEINGHSAHALLDSINSDNYIHILKAHGLVDIDQDAWYPLQDLLNVLNDMAKQSTVMMDFVSIGMAAGTNGVLPSETQHLSLWEFFVAYGQNYQNLHRNGDAGSFQVEKTDQNHLALTLNVPYPDDLMYGLIYGYARRFANGHQFIVAYDEEIARKDQGGDYTVIHVIWQ